MSDISPLPPPEPTYQAIEATLAGHERGRRFLAEHARRSRHEETAALLEAVARLHERAAEAAPAATGLAALPILRDLAATAAAGLADAADPAAADDGTSEMVEHLQETAWTMREAGTDAALCDLLDGLATRLSRTCRAHDQRDLALGRARDAVSRLGRHLAELEPGTAAGGDGGPHAAAPDNSTVPSEGEHVVVAQESASPGATRSRRRSRTRPAGPDAAGDPTP